MKETPIVRIERDRKEGRTDMVTEEVPLTVHCNGKELVTLLCSPGDLKDLSAGFIYSTGLIRSFKEIKSIVIDDRNWISYITLTIKKRPSELLFKRLYTSGCGRGTFLYSALDTVHKRKITGRFSVSSEGVSRMMDAFQRKSKVFKETGGVHSAALSDGNGISVFKEDIGRHNALDKVIGEALRREIPVKARMVLTSGRVSSEIVQKAQKAGVPFLVSRSAPTDTAIALARSINMTLIGFVRGRRMNIYAGDERVT